MPCQGPCLDYVQRLERWKSPFPFWKNAFSPRKIYFFWLKSLFFFYKNYKFTHLRPALIIITTSFRACWKQLTGYGEGQVFFLFFFLENIIEMNCKAAVRSFYLIVTLI